MNEHYDIFISYKRRDKKKVFEVKDYIEKNIGVNCWIDLDGIESDAQFANVIIKAINNAQVFLFMYSRTHGEIENYETDWTVREVNFAQTKKKRIVFVNVDGAVLTDWFVLMFGTKQQIDASSENAMQKLCKDLTTWLKIEPIINTKSPRTIIGTTEGQRKPSQDTEKLYQEGKWYVDTFHDNDKAIKYLLQAAKADHKEAQNLLGLVLCKEKEYAQALKWFMRAAENGHPTSQYNIGKIYYKGLLGTFDFPNALKWFIGAAKRGSDEANNMLGVMYEEGKGVTQSYDTAYEYYLVAANAGNAAAQYNIGCLIEQNKITHYGLNKTDAFKWFELAAKQGDKDAEAKIKKLRQQRR